MKTKIIELKIGQSYMTAFINSDESGLSGEDKTNIKSIIEQYGPYFHVYMPENEEPNFECCDVSGLFDNCYTCEVEVADENS